MESKEAEKIYEWSIRHEGSYQYSKTDQDSYFMIQGDTNYIREYGFESIAELRTELGNMWFGDVCMEEMIKPVAVAAMKNEPSNMEIRDARKSLDEFIYIF